MPGTAALAPLLAAVALLLAGCGQPAAPPSEAPSGFEGFDIPEGAVALRGVVVSEAIVPLANVTVTIDGGRPTTTTAAGLFAFVGVAPGPHVLRATKVGYHEASAVVTASEGDDSIARIQLLADPATTPFHQMVSVRGFLQCGMGIPGGGAWSVCQAPNGAFDILCDTSGDVVCLPYISDHRGLLEVDVEDGLVPTFAQAEAVWEATSPTSEVLSWGSYARTRGTLEFNNGTTTTGPSPVTMPWNGTRLADAAIGAGAIFVFQVYPEMGGVGNLVLQQPVDLFVTMFYHYQPPEGWTLAADGPPHPPR